MDRPALKTLLDQIKEKRIDVVVVYKVDRLTRSLADFAKIVEIFDAHGVSFVAVTQQFNTTTSMGRLTLNVLLSFAQFEREVTGERIRDKIAASKQKGMWMGGTPPLGYDLRDRCLVVNQAEAETVRLIFRLYLELKTLRKVREELDRRSIVSKQWVSSGSVRHGGYAFGRGALDALDELVLGVALKGEELVPRLTRERGRPFLDGLEGVGPINLRLARAEQIQVRAVQQQHSGHRGARLLIGVWDHTSAANVP
jgi:DNA invertase Pin-like site-specific DNA recombinase